MLKAILDFFKTKEEKKEEVKVEPPVVETKVEPAPIVIDTPVETKVEPAPIVIDTPVETKLEPVVEVKVEEPAPIKIEPLVEITLPPPSPVHEPVLELKIEKSETLEPVISTEPTLTIEQWSPPAEPVFVESFVIADEIKLDSVPASTIIPAEPEKKPKRGRPKTNKPKTGKPKTSKKK